MTFIEDVAQAIKAMESVEGVSILTNLETKDTELLISTEDVGYALILDRWWVND